MSRHLTPGEKRRQADAAAAIARAWAHTRPPAPPPDDQVERYPITPAVARQIRLELEQEHRC